MSTRLMNFKATDDDQTVIKQAAELADATYSDVIRIGIRRVLGDLLADPSPDTKTDAAEIERLRTALTQIRDRPRDPQGFVQAGWNIAALALTEDALVG